MLIPVFSTLPLILDRPLKHLEECTCWYKPLWGAVIILAFLASTVLLGSIWHYRAATPVAAAAVAAAAAAPRRRRVQYS